MMLLAIVDLPVGTAQSTFCEEQKKVLLWIHSGLVLSPAALPAIRQSSWAMLKRRMAVALWFGNSVQLWQPR
ncbi:hypothetical protein GCM10020219_059480 [Nonomuraea dietziae]